MNQTQTKIVRRRPSAHHLSGQAAFKLLSILALSAAGVFGFLFLNGSRAHEAELARVRAENQQELAKQVEEMERLRNENKEIERLRSESQELAKLRADAAKLRDLQKEQQKYLSENQQLKSTIQQLQQVGSENSNLRNQNQQLQGVLSDRANIQACIVNLKAIESVKSRWATDFQKQPTDVPLDADLFGPGKYFPQKPACPSGGAYTLGPVQVKPTCTMPGHTY